jgi:serine phosphatase RsbU (regulator of sigma subunit)
MSADPVASATEAATEAATGAAIDPDGEDAAVDDPERSDTEQDRTLHVVSVLVLVAGVVLTVVLGFAAQTAHDRNEDRLLEQQTKQAAAVLTAALPGIQTPLAASVEVAEQGGGEQTPFRRLMTPIVESGQPFVSASLWAVDSDPPVPVEVVGAEPKLVSQPPEVIRSLLRRSAETSGLVVTGLLDGDHPRLGYSYTSDTGNVQYVVYAEAALPTQRVSPPPSDSAFIGVDYAIYLGESETTDALLTASTERLPLTGRHAVQSVPFGDSTLLLVMSPTTELGGSLLAMFPWLVGAVGALSTVAAMTLVELLLRRRDRADMLAEQNQQLYANQLSVSRTLQQSLLPQQLPDIAGLEMAARYVPGVAGLDIGGDWYDVVDIDEQRVLLVVGDVSGRGLEAGTMMASLRYAIRAFASRGDDPTNILVGLTRLLDVVRDRHFATVLCAIVDVEHRTITIANAGHPAPIVLDSSGVSFLATNVGPPIGVASSYDYSSVTHVLAPGSTVIMFTDGVFERRGETVDTGLERLRTSVPAGADRLDDVLDGLVAHQIIPESHDDSALLGVQWTTNPTT